MFHEKKIICKNKFSLGQAGFTLIEILIALFIFAIIAVMTAVGIRRIIHTQQRVSLATAALQQLQLGITLFEHDMRAISPHAIKPDESSMGNALQTTGNTLKFITANHVNPGMYADYGLLRQVVYAVQGGNWVRQAWPVTDPMRQTPSITRILLSGVESVTYKFVNQTGDLDKSWPPGENSEAIQNIMLGWRGSFQLQSQQQLPAGIEVTITTQQFGIIRRLLVLNQIYETKFDASQGSS